MSGIQSGKALCRYLWDLSLQVAAMTIVVSDSSRVSAASHTVVNQPVSEGAAQSNQGVR